MRLKLVTVPNKLLRQKSSPFDTFTSKDEQFLANLAETLLQKNDPPGVGLSAVQVGELKRVFVTYLPPLFDLGQNAKNTPKSEIKFFINPEIIDHSGQTTLGDNPKTPALEGCLSVPALYGPVSRYQTVKVKYQTLGDAEVKKFMHAAGPHEVGASTAKTSIIEGFLQTLPRALAGYPSLWTIVKTNKGNKRMKILSFQALDTRHQALNIVQLEGQTPSLYKQIKNQLTI